MKQKKTKKYEKGMRKLYFLIFFPIFWLLFYIICNYIVVEFYLLLGVMLTNISIVIFSVFLLFLFGKDFLLTIKEKKVKEALIRSFWIGFFLLFFVVSSLEVIDGIKDCFVGPKEVFIGNYTVTRIKVRKSPTKYKVVGYDNDGNKYVLESRKIISKYENKMSVIYYENIKMIKSFKYY